MPLETLLVKVKTAIPPKLLMKKKPSFTIRHHKQYLAVLAFEVAGTISNLLHLHHSLSDPSAAAVRLRNHAVSLHGVRKIVSDDESFLLGLARAEFAESLRAAADSVARLAARCTDHSLRSFRRSFIEFADSGRDPNGWAQSGPKETEAKIKKLERYVTLTATLHREMEELTVLENGLKKILSNHNRNSENNSNSNSEGSFSLKDQQKAYEIQQKIFFQRQEVKDLKERSLWSRSFDSVVTLLARLCFAVLARLKLVFGVVGHQHRCLPRSSSACSSAAAAVYPSDHHNPTPCSDSDSGSMESLKLEDEIEEGDYLGETESGGFFECHCKVLKKPPSNTLGAHALALHYANLIIVMEKMIRSPQLVGADARDDLYSMLPCSIRCALRGRLRGVGFCASDPVLAGEWGDALGRILGWLSPLAHNMIRWQSERSFEQHSSSSSKSNCYLVHKSTNSVLLLQTLFFADKVKAEAAITELLVGLNYIWRFEREMTVKAFFECANFNGLVNLQKLSS